MTKTFEEWMRPFNPTNAELNKVVLAYLRFLYDNAEREDMLQFIEIPEPGNVSKYAVYTHTMRMLSAMSRSRFPDGYVFQTHTMQHPILNPWLETDERMGCTEENVVDQVRFIRHLKPEALAHIPEGAPQYKQIRKRAGATLHEVITEVYPELPEELTVWCCEMFAQQWRAVNSYSQYELHVDRDFWKIYNPRYHDGDFGSCMAKSDTWSGNWTFYEKSVKAHAAYICKKGSSLMVARCIIFDEVLDETTGEVYRMAERQYATGKRDSLKTALIELLKAEGYIDAYKVVGASYSDRNAIVDAYSGESLSQHNLSIECSLCCGDNVSYQDSFSLYSVCSNRAYNNEVTSDGQIVSLAVCESWYDNDFVACSRPLLREDKFIWFTDAFHRRYVAGDRSTTLVTAIHYYDPVTGAPESLLGIPYNRAKPGCSEPDYDVALCENGELWFIDDTVVIDNKRYPRNAFVKSRVDNCLVPKTEAVMLYNGDYCYKRNAVKIDNVYYHCSDVVYSNLCKSWSVRPMCNQVGEEWLIRGEKDSVSDPGSRLSEDGTTIEVRCKNGKWRPVEKAEWDGDGWYDQQDYVNAWYPVRIRAEHGKPNYQFKKHRLRKHMAWKCKDGKWYHRYFVYRNLMDGSPIAHPKGLTFKGKLKSKSYQDMASWAADGCPVLEALDEKTAHQYEVICKALGKTA